MSTFSLQNAEQTEKLLCQRLETIRLSRNVTQAELAAESGVSIRTIRRMENGEGVSLATFIRVLKALQLADRLDALVPNQTVQPIERVNSASIARERASGKHKKKNASGGWQWGDE